MTASGSGLDPEISIANARLQAARVASAVIWRGSGCQAHQRAHLAARLGILGEQTVNVLELNLALDRLTS